MVALFTCPSQKGGREGAERGKGSASEEHDHQPSPETTFGYVLDNHLIYSSWSAMRIHYELTMLTIIQLSRFSQSIMCSYTCQSFTTNGTQLGFLMMLRVVLCLRNSKRY